MRTRVEKRGRERERESRPCDFDLRADSRMIVQLGHVGRNSKFAEAMLCSYSSIVYVHTRLCFHVCMCGVCSAHTP